MTDLPLTARRYLAPVVLDLDGDGIELTSFVNSTILFDMDGDGRRDRTSWTAADDGLLVYDRNGNHLVDGADEISFQALIAGAASDLEGLRFFDTNNNGLLDSGDAAYSSFWVWQDENQNGISEASEMTSLIDAEITQINLQGTRTGNVPDGRDTVIFANSTYSYADGTIGDVADSLFVFEPETPVDEPNNPGSGDGGTGGTPGTGGEMPAPPSLALQTQTYSRKAKKYRIEARDGQIFVAFKKNSNPVDPRAGAVGPAMILDFRNRDVGLLAPIILDLDGDGLELKSAKKSRATFDMDGDGVRDDTGWIGRGDGILAIDRNNDGLITSASELSFLTEKPGARSDLEALAALDSNRDGKINKDDTRFKELKIWVDGNENGITDEGELLTLTQASVTEINLNGRDNSQRVKPGENLLIATTTFTRANGTTGSVGDVALAFDPSSTRPRPATVSTWSQEQSSGLRERQFEAMREALTSVGETVRGAAAMMLAHDPLASKLALITQAIASFGPSVGENELARRDMTDSGLNFFAIS